MSDIQQYGNFIKEIKDLIYRRQYEAMKAVNKELINLYWEIGEEINNQQTEKGWGKSIVEVLAKELQKEFPGVQGFSAANLWRMRNFYLSYSKNEKLAPLVREISWTKNVLIHNLENNAYHKYLLNQTNFDEAVPEKYRLQAKLSVKDDYNFDFLEMGLEHSEAELEAAIVRNIRAFLSEMGDDYTFIGNQYHLPVGNENFYIDLLLFHRRLKSLIAIELKIGHFQPEYAGKMQFYLTVLDETKKLEDENPSIGIIVCKSKDRTIVEYALKSSDKAIGVTTYNMYDKLPAELKNLLPEPDEIAERLTVLD